MSQPLTIQYISHQRINKQKWDNCITHAAQGTIYAYSWYLDAMAKNWDALVAGDYEIVMPITWNKKYGIHYLYQPAFTASLGVFGNAVTQTIVNDFIKAIPAKFRLIQISLNAGNMFAITPADTVARRVNYILALNQPYENIKKAYRENHKRNIQKAINLGCTVKKNINFDEIIALSKESLQHIVAPADEDYNRLKQLYTTLAAQNKAVMYGVYNAQQQLLSGCTFFFSNNRAYYILAGSNPISKTIGASHFLIDSFIREHANTHLVLDFEGSDIRSLAFFYNGFGAQIEYYPALHINRLPFYLKWLKK